MYLYFMLYIFIFNFMMFFQLSLPGLAQPPLVCKCECLVRSGGLCVNRSGLRSFFRVVVFCLLCLRGDQHKHSTLFPNHLSEYTSGCWSKHDRCCHFTPYLTCCFCFNMTCFSFTDTYDCCQPDRHSNNVILGLVSLMRTCLGHFMPKLKREGFEAQGSSTTTFSLHFDHYFDDSIFSKIINTFPMFSGF